MKILSFREVIIVYYSYFGKMISYKTDIRVLYSDTDQMGIVHHSNYLKYYETARWELFRSLGISYKSIENEGYIVPVIRINTHYIKAIHYDDIVTIITTLKTIKGSRIWFHYKLYTLDGVLVNEAETELAFVKKENRKPCLVPEFVNLAITDSISSKT